MRSPRLLSCRCPMAPADLIGMLSGDLVDIRSAVEQEERPLEASASARDQCHPSDGELHQQSRRNRARESRDAQRSLARHGRSQTRRYVRVCRAIAALGSIRSGSLIRRRNGGAVQGVRRRSVLENETPADDRRRARTAHVRHSATDPCRSRRCAAHPTLDTSGTLELSSLSLALKKQTNRSKKIFNEFTMHPIRTSSFTSINSTAKTSSISVSMRNVGSR